MSNNFGAIANQVFIELGIEIENIVETQEFLTIYISVPESSCNKNAYGEEMSGAILAKRFKTALEDMGVKRLTVKSRIRKGQHWTKEMGEAAKLDYRKHMYGNQY